jgi:Lon protease-like protein
VSDIGLFPLGLVLLPGERIPLHIFEERYKELIDECLDTGAEFGIVLQDDEGMRSVGTSALVTDVVERFDDGRLNVVVEGRRRFEVQEITTGRSFITARVQLVPDEDKQPSADEIDACLEAFRRLTKAAGIEGDAPTPEGKPLSFAIGGLIGFEDDLKQALLELRSESDRLQRLIQMLDAAVEVLERRAEIGEIARGNGHVGPE